MGKKNVYLKAYFRKNLGDDLFVRCIANRYPEIKFQIFTHPRYCKAFEKIGNIRQISYLYWLFERLITKMGGPRICQLLFEKFAQVVVHVGGSIFIEPSKFVQKNKTKYPRNIFFIGCNFGPYKTQEYYNYIHDRLSNAIDVCFRDSYSYEKFPKLKNTRLEPDVLFGYKGYPKCVKGEGIGISVIDLKTRTNLKISNEEYIDTIIELIQSCIQKNIKVKLLGFCIEEGDKTIISQIMEKVIHENVNAYCYDGDIETFLDEFNSCEYIVASRFHAMIIGWVLRKKVFPIVYSKKQLNVMKDVGYQGKYWDLMRNLKYNSEDLLKDCLGVSLLNNVEEYARRAEYQFKAFDEFVLGMKGAL